VGQEAAGVNLDFTDEQQALRDLVRGVCAEHSPVSVVRAMEDDARGWPDALWKQLGESGVLGILVPELHGGAGQGVLDAAIVFEELGRALAPTPAFVSSVVCASALLSAGSEAQRAEWLPRVASGAAVLTPAWLEPQRGFAAHGVQLRARREGASWLLGGVKRSVAFASFASRLLVLARTGDAPSDVTWLLVDPNSVGVRAKQSRGIASDTQYEVSFAGVRVDDAARIGEVNAGWAAWERVMQDAIVALAAFANGACERALEITVQYAKDRKQFDKPIGAFQAISHYLADASTALGGSRYLTYEAASVRDAGGDTARLAPMAKLFACDTFRDTTAMCQQVWGGVGFTIEYDIQLFFRRAKALQLAWYDPPHLEESIARAVLA
jgi:alkylation response protein AidB-like acyl-CoA dehydrogenase